MPYRYNPPPEPEGDVDVRATAYGNGSIGSRFVPGTSRTTQMFLLGAALLIATAGLVLGGFALGTRAPSSTISPDSLAGYFGPGKLVVVELSGGETYYGKLSSQGGLLQLSDIYYTNATGQLVQRGGEAFGPDGPMILDPAQIMRIEPVGPESAIARQIAAIEKNNRSPITTTTTNVIGFQ